MFLVARLLYARERYDASTRRLYIYIILYHIFICIFYFSPGALVHSTIVLFTFVFGVVACRCLSSVPPPPPPPPRDRLYRCPRAPRSTGKVRSRKWRRSWRPMRRYRVRPALSSLASWRPPRRVWLPRCEGAVVTRGMREKKGKECYKGVRVGLNTFFFSGESGKP